MNSVDPVLFRELPVIRKIIEDETWLEGERRGCPVSPYDPAVREKVCLVILRIGAQLRESLAKQAGNDDMSGDDDGRETPPARRPLTAA
jgi:hypothetical protein